jgi:uroporphyrin-III C-methyltransferase / precorrin-2 dehydrogenase / sirohydrochlorin ferrochelatase
MLPARIGELATLLRRYRSRLAEARHGAHLVRRFWEKAVDGRIGAAVVAGRGREAEAALIRDIANIGKETRSKQSRPTGTVHLVGAGPGDPDLLTLRALHALQGADVVFYDELVTPGILDRARRDAERVFVGKRRGAPGLGQDEINRHLRDAAREGHNVVRLKGGDPFVFGRGGEEVDYLRRHDVPVIVVPGITAALGCAAEAGLPLTLRNAATRLCLITAQRADQALETDWSGLADPHTTVVVYMGLAAASAVRDGLIAAGRDPRTPVAVLARGTRPDAASVTGSLQALETLAAQVGEGPALIVVGEVVAHSDPWLAARAAQEIAA